MANEPASMRTPLGRIRYLGSARSGTTQAWHMRLTAIALVPLTIAFIWLILSLVGKDYNGVRSELGQPVPGDADAALPHRRDLSHASSAYRRSSRITCVASRPRSGR